MFRFSVKDAFSLKSDLIDSKSPRWIERTSCVSSVSSSGSFGVSGLLFSVCSDLDSGACDDELDESQAFQNSRLATNNKDPFNNRIFYVLSHNKKKGG